RTQMRKHGLLDIRERPDRFARAGLQNMRGPPVVAIKGLTEAIEQLRSGRLERFHFRGLVRPHLKYPCMPVVLARGAPRFDGLMQDVTFRRLLAMLMNEERRRRDLV